MKKAMELLFAAVGLALCLLSNAVAANSITYTVGGWQITMTDLGLLPGGSASRALAINNLGRKLEYDHGQSAVSREAGAAKLESGGACGAERKDVN
jgi:hypothetical protein